MKNTCIIFLLSIIISLTAVGVCLQPNLAKNQPVSYAQEYLRIHVRADSNTEEAQSVKYLVRDEIVRYLTPIVAECETQAQSVCSIQKHLPQLAERANYILKKEGVSYGATASLAVEQFPTRVYDGYTLPKGEYTALIIALGSGQGDNWWCVVYPPLCFAGMQASVVYKSKIVEIIRNWKNG